MTQAEMAQPQQTRRQHGVENRAGNEFMVLAQEPQIIIRAVHDEFVPGQRIEQRIEIEPSQRINQFIASHGANLNEADLLGVSVQAVRLGIQRYPLGATDRWQKSCQLCFSVYHAGHFIPPPKKGDSKI